MVLVFINPHSVLAMDGGKPAAPMEGPGPMTRRSSSRDSASSQRASPYTKPKVPIASSGSTGLTKYMGESTLHQDWDDTDPDENPRCVPSPYLVLLPPASTQQTSLNAFTPNPGVSDLKKLDPQRTGSKFGPNTITNKLFKKGDRLYREGTYTLWRDDANDYHVAYASDERAPSMMSVRSFRSTSGEKDSPGGSSVGGMNQNPSNALVLKIVVTNEARLEFEIITQEVPACPCHTPRGHTVPMISFASMQTVWKMRAAREAHFQQVCATPREHLTAHSPCASRPHTVPQHRQTNMHTSALRSGRSL